MWNVTQHGNQCEEHLKLRPSYVSKLTGLNKSSVKATSGLKGEKSIFRILWKWVMTQLMALADFILSCGSHLQLM